MTQVPLAPPPPTGNSIDRWLYLLWRNLTATTAGYTVATLPAGTVGDRAYVTNALAPAYGAVVVGGGAVTVPVFYNGAAWICA